ncbi:MAG: ABC transporter substrate-binding protein [Pseudolabrys sp.]|jgi:putative ABC transport system substrate-binding protein
MKRREFIGLVGGAAIALPLGARAQEPGRIYRLAVVISSGRDEPPTAAFLDELREQGFVEGKNLEFIPGGFRFDNQQTAAVVPAIVKAAPDAIVVAGDFIAEKFQKETKSIPLVVMTEDMIAAGFAASLAKPGGNITGISLMSPDLDGKRQDILIEAVPGAQRIAVLADSNVATLQHLRALEATARSAHGKELLVVRAANSSEIIPAVNDANAQGAAALNVLSSPMLHLNRFAIIERATQLRLPAIYQWPETADEGGLLAYGPSFIEVFRQRARMVAKVLRGVKPADLPIEQPSTFKLSVNLKTAKSMNQIIPAALLLRADKLIE